MFVSNLSPAAIITRLIRAAITADARYAPESSPNRVPTCFPLRFSRTNSCHERNRMPDTGSGGAFMLLASIHTPA